METKYPVVTDPEDLPWSKDAPDGWCWRCPDCGSQTILGGNAAYHAQVKHHSAPVLELDPESGRGMPTPPSVAVSVTPGRVVLNDLWLVIDRPDVKIISGDSETKHAEVLGYSASEVYLGLTPYSLHGGDDGPDWTTVTIELPEPPEGSFWMMEPSFARDTLTIVCWLEGASGAPLWERGDLDASETKQARAAEVGGELVWTCPQGYESATPLFTTPNPCECCGQAPVKVRVRRLGLKSDSTPQ